MLIFTCIFYVFLILSQTSPGFTCLQYKSSENTVQKDEQFLLFPQCILPFEELSSILTLSQTSLGFTCLQYKSSENTVRKGEIARDEQFLLFPQCFLPV